MDSYGSLSIPNPGIPGEEEEVPSPEDCWGSSGIPSSEENQESPEEEGIESLQGNEIKVIKIHNKQRLQTIMSIT